jgi:hypothetical protein
MLSKCKKWLRRRIHVDVVIEHLNMIQIISNMMVPSSVADPGSGAFLTPDPGLVKNQVPGRTNRIRE